jgi:apolipoprotein N-acyltransferase
LPLASVALAQAAGMVVAGGLLLVFEPEGPRHPLAWAALQGAVAAAVAAAARAPRWWWLIHFSFVPLVVLALRLEFAPGWYLGAFVVLLLVFWRTDKSRVPLFLSNARTAAAVAGLLPAGPRRVVDLGCGLLCRVARAHPQAQFVGIEHAPLPWLVARLRTLRRHNIDIRYGDLWTVDLSSFDVAYAFLSPAPMPRLWAKVVAEMQPGALLVSNSFVVPDVAPARELTVGDRRKTRLFSYRV